MRKESGRDVIRIRGARQNNLKGFDLELPTRSLIVITGLSGSGKSSLAFDTLYAEGQRRYIETFSPYARQFFDRMDKPRVDAIEGIPPAIALEQRNSVRTTRSTVGTMTEICDHLKLLWPHLARLHCRQCGRPVTREAPQDVWASILRRREGTGSAGVPATEDLDVLVTFRIPLSPKLQFEEQVSLITRQGFQRILLNGEVIRLEEAASRVPKEVTHLTVIQDRIRVSATQRARFVEACEQAYHFGHGKLEIVLPGQPAATNPDARWADRQPFSRHLHCARCDIDYKEPTPALFSFNHPLGACPACKGFGRIIAIDYRLAIPDRSLSLEAGCVKPWQTETGFECQEHLLRWAKRVGVDIHAPFRELPPEHQEWVIEGDPDYGPDNEWPKAWYGVKGYFRWLESRAYKMHVRVLLSRYRAYRTCPTCNGQRLQPDSLLWLLPVPAKDASGTTSEPAPERLSIADFYALPVEEALALVQRLELPHQGRKNDPFHLALEEIRARLSFLQEVGLGYLTLDRPTRTLSGGETQRVNLTTCLGSRLVNTLFVLDEPSVGLHARDVDRLVRILTRLRDLGNTVVVVEHEAAIMRAADHIVDLGPGHGESGGELVAEGNFQQVLQNSRSLTGGYLSGRLTIKVPARRPLPRRQSANNRRERPADSALVLGDRIEPYSGGNSLPGWLTLRGVNRHNLRNLDVEIPLGRLVCLTGVSGSGKTTLASELLQLLRAHFGIPVSGGQLEVREAEHETDNDEAETGENGDQATTSGARLEGAEQLQAVMLVDQSPIGRTPRSNPAVYTGAFEHLRELFAQSPDARHRDLTASSFSFNSRLGQCEQCRGAGFEKIEMQFLSDVFIRCPACNGRRYRQHILDIKVAVPPLDPPLAGSIDELSIADFLELTVEDALRVLDAMKEPPAGRAASRLRVLSHVGLGYLRLGQPINTLSGGESQRLKLAGHFASILPGSAASRALGDTAANATPENGRRAPTLFIFDEPTTGLHFEDVRVLLQVFQGLVADGHSVLIIEHNLELLKCADWLIDLGPGGGRCGGQIVVAGTPEDVAACPESHTGRALRTVLSANATPDDSSRTRGSSRQPALSRRSRA